MSKLFDPRKVLRNLSNRLLEQFFTPHGELLDVPWSELDETDVEPIYEAWQRLPDRQREDVQVILQEVTDLADDRGLCLLAKEVHQRYPHLEDEFRGLNGRADRVLWAAMYAYEAYHEAAIFARADALAGGRYWVKRNGLPRRPIQVTPDLTFRLEDELSRYYWDAQMRGSQCRVEHYTRGSGGEYFFAYLDDYPDHHVVFGDDGEFERRFDRGAFENVFVFQPQDGTLETYARGGKSVHVPLQWAFSRAVLDVNADPAEPLKPAYCLDHLLNEHGPLRTDPRDQVAEAKIVRMRLALRTGPARHLEIKVDPKGEPGDLFHAMMHHLNTNNLLADRVHVDQATFRLTFMNDGLGRSKVLTFNVSAPSSCDLKGQADDVRMVGERCLKLWGVADA